MRKSIAIIGAGVGGLAAGCYALMNGYDCRIFEMHKLPGGVCTSWKRRGFTFDGCIHHLAGCLPGTRFNRVWEELGVLPGQAILYPEDLVRVESPDGAALHIYTDLERLQEHMRELAPGDVAPIEEYIQAAYRFTRFTLLDHIGGSPREFLGLVPHLPAIAKWSGVNMAKYAKRFSDAFLARSFPFIQYDTVDAPLSLHLQMLAGCSNRYYGWPAGGSLEFARAIERRYLRLGGEIDYGARVGKVLVRANRAVGVRLEDGSKCLADMVISNANGRTTIFDMLEGKFTNRTIIRLYSNPEDRISVGIHISMGVARDLSREPHAMVLLLEQPVEIAGEMRDRLSLELFGFDPSMAPAGKGVLKAVLNTSYSYWKGLHRYPEKYRQEKANAASAVIDKLNVRFPGLEEQIEVLDVATPITTERYTGNGAGFKYTPSLLFKGTFSRAGLSMILPGLDNFYMVGQWASFPSLPNVASMGRNLVKRICREDGRYFTTNVS